MKQIVQRVVARHVAGTDEDELQADGRIWTPPVDNALGYGEDLQDPGKNPPNNPGKGKGNIYECQGYGLGGEQKCYTHRGIPSGNKSEYNKKYRKMRWPGGYGKKQAGAAKAYLEGLVQQLVDLADTSSAEAEYALFDLLFKAYLENDTGAFTRVLRMYGVPLAHKAARELLGHMKQMKNAFWGLGRVKADRAYNLQDKSTGSFYAGGTYSNPRTTSDLNRALVLDGSMLLKDERWKVQWTAIQATTGYGGEESFMIEASEKAASQEVAKTILLQMGGVGRITAMTGASNFVSGNNYVSFKFPNRGRRHPNYVKVTYAAGDDLYNMEFGRICGVDYKVLSTDTGVYGDMLKPIFEKTTGLRLSL